ncbi:uncharacterized protein L199_000080 [Kwoniella botswanensis]|uniref:uncharacterized protein n=1 Tax=Kwoniella botswanensis TaxID=1268659 RepID=UPI00315D0775
MSAEEDMSLTPISPQPLPLPTVELSFDTYNGGAWDDRELIRASEAAMKEFHAHHPGPGSWLDKATAALAKGQKLPGADDYGTAWYSASLTSETEGQAEASTSTRVKVNDNTNGNGTQSNKRRKTKRTNMYDTNIPNPYLPSTSISTDPSHSQSARKGSPTYNPGSPTSRPIQELNTDSDSESDSEEDFYDEEEVEDEEYDEDAEWNLPTQHQQQQYGSGYDQLFPSLGVYPPGGINREEALGYAMTAQYWAGYWMGVAQSQNQSVSQSQGNGNGVGYQQDQREKRSKRRRRVNFDLGDEDDTTVDAFKFNQMNGNGNVQPTNLKVTKKRFDPVINGLRR